MAGRCPAVDGARCPVSDVHAVGNVVHVFGGDTVALLDTGAQTVTDRVNSLAFDASQPQWLLFTRSQNLYRMHLTTFAVEPV